MGHARDSLPPEARLAYGHYGCLPPGPKPLAASPVIRQRVRQEDPADCAKLLYTDHITHQSSFPFEKGPFGA